MAKGLSHKYVARTPNPNPPPKWRYRYTYASKGRGGRSLDVRTVHYGHTFKVGEAFKDSSDQHTGHWHVVNVDDSSGRVTFKHDETGHLVTHSRYEAFDFVNGLHAAGHKAERDARAARWRADAKRAAGEAMAECEAFERAPSGRAAVRVARAWARVRARADEAKWSTIDIARELGVDKLPTSPAALDSEIRDLFSELEGCGITLNRLPHEPSLVFAAADPNRIKQLARFAVLGHYADHLNRSGAFGYREEPDAVDFPESWRYRGQQRVTARELPNAETLAEEIKGAVTERKVIEALKRRYDGALGKTCFWLHNNRYSAPWGREETARGREVYAVFEQLARTRPGFLPLVEDDAAADKADEWLAQAVGSAMRLAGVGEPAPELLAGDRHTMPDDAGLIALAIAQRGRGDWRSPDEPNPAVEARLTKAKNPIVSMVPGDLGVRDKGTWRRIQIPLGMVAKAARADQGRTVVKFREEHAARWASVKGKMDTVDAKVSNIIGQSAGRVTENARLKIQEVTAAAGVDPAAALASFDQSVSAKFSRGHGYRAHARAAFEAAYEAAIPRPAPYEVSEFGEDTPKDVAASIRSWREARSAAFDAVHEQTSTEILQGIVAALGYTPAAASLEAGTEEEIKAGFASSRAIKDEAAGQHVYSSYDMSADPGGLRHLFAICAPGVIPEGVRIDVTSAKIRAHAARSGVCRVSETSGRRGSRIDLTLIHEFGHQIEHANPGITQACNTLRDQRSAGENRRKLSEINAFDGKPDTAYEDHEVAYADKWETAYIGKWYGHMSSTEVLSMGVERLVDDPATFALQDPEHFRLTVAALAGMFGTATPGHFAAVRAKGRS